MVLIWKSFDYILFCCVLRKAPSIYTCFRKITRNKKKHCMLFPKSYLCRDKVLFLLQKRHNCSFSLGKRIMKQHWLCNDRSLLTFPSNSNWEVLLCKGDSKKHRYKATCRIGNTAALTRTLLFDTFADAELLFTEPVPSEIHCGFITVLTQANEFLWGMNSAQQFPQKRKKQAKNTSVLLMNSTWSRVNDLVQKKQHQRQPRTPWSRDWLPCFIDQASCRHSLKLRWGNTYYSSIRGIRFMPYLNFWLAADRLTPV